MWWEVFATNDTGISVTIKHQAESGLPRWVIEAVMDAFQVLKRPGGNVVFQVSRVQK